MFVNHGDICNIKGDSVEQVDCIIGGSPCQDLSLAGSKQGLSGSRSCLFLEQMRIVEEMRVSSNGKKPRYMVWENVTNSLSCNNGKDFQHVLMECINVAVRTSFCMEQKQRKYTENSQTIRDKRQQSIPDVPMPKNGKWAKSGILYDDLGRWSIAWRIHDAQYWGVAQRRRRIALVVDFRGLTAPEVLFERKSSTRNIDQSNTQRKAASRCFSECFEKSNRESDQIKNNNNVFTYDARDNGDGNRECPTLQAGMGLSGSYVPMMTDIRRKNSDTTNPVFSLNGDAHESGMSCIKEISHTLKVTTKEVVAVHEAVCCEEKQCQSYPCICIGNGQSHVTNHYTVELSQTLNCMHDPMTILEPTTSCYYVRRLTPLECTRLQGFPDGWVDIGDWRDSKGKLHKEADAPKYKALGNSIALPFWKWLCKNIVTELRKDGYTTTMASLFDGIGGFPLCWTEATGNVNDVKWISEIEEFPIAVTRYHFG